jgi:CspA family cold shock protein
MLAGTHTGTVKWFSDETGEGYIIPDDGGNDLFVCFTGVAALQGGAFRVLVQDARVSYEVITGRIAQRAENVKRIS